MNIGDLFLSLRGDDKQLQVDVVKSGDKAAQGFAAQFKAKLGPALKQAGGALIGAGIGAIFSTAIKGAAELNAAVSSFAADTGATAEEAASAQKAIAGAFKENLQGFDEIGQTMAVLRTDMGLDQKAAEKLTGAFLKFATATKQNATAAARDFDDILDAWNLTADDSKGIMDKLIVSHQRYGGSIEDNQKVLAKLAPALQAANLTIDDGIGLLNLFSVAGIDSATSTRALNTALGKVKSPEELQRLIDDIVATQDPFLRAQKAIDLFGAKAGPQLAQALSKGGLDKFTVSMDDAAGATDEAAKVIENSFGNQFQLLMKKATGALAEFGTAFGPLLIGASSVLPHLRPILTAAGGALGAIFGKALGLGTRKVAATAIGTAVDGAVTDAGSRIGKSGTRAGRLLGAGMRLGLIGIGIAIVGVFDDIINKGIERNLKDLNKRTSKFLSEASIETLKQTRKGLEEELARAGNLFEFGSGGGGSIPFPFSLLGTGGLDLKGGKQLIQDKIDEVDAQMESLTSDIEQRTKDAAEAAAGLGPGIADGIDAGIPAIETSTEALVKKFGTLLGGVAAAAKSQGAAGMLALSQGIEENRQTPADAFDRLLDLLKNPLPRWKEQSRLVGQLTSKALQDGLHSWDPVIRAQAEGTRDLILERLGQISPAGAAIGTDAAKKLEAGLKSNDAGIRDAARDAKAAITGTLAPLPGAVKKTAADAGASIAPAINSANNRTDIRNAVSSVVRLVNSLLGGISDAYVNVNVKAVNTAAGRRASGGPVSAGVPYIVGERQAELFVPTVSGRIVPSIGTAERQGNRGGDTYQITVPVQGLLRAETPEDVARPLRRLASLGELAGLAPTLRTRTTG